MNKVEEIKNQLARRLEQQAKVPAPMAVSEEMPRPSPKEGTLPIVKTGASKTISKLKQALPEPSKQGGEGVIKLSVSLYASDIICLDEIKDFMRERGVRRLSDSEALRMACRAVVCNDKFLDIYGGMQGEDRRRRKADE